MSFKKFNPLLSAGIQDSFDPNNDVSEAVNTDAVTMRDTAGAKKWSIKHNTNIVKYDHYSPEPDNKLLNSGFETDLTSWTSTLSYTLNDQFTTDRAAGAVNGTSAEPTGGTRTVTDTNSKLSITGSQLSFATGGSAAGNPGLWYSSLVRGAGKAVVGTITPTTATTGMAIGFDTNQTGTPYDSIYFNTGGALGIYINGSYKAVGTYTLGSTYKIAVILRSTGEYFYIQGGTEYPNWTLLFIDSTVTTTPVYPGLAALGTGEIFTADNIRIPTATWLPTPLAYDTFTRADGTIGSSETTGPDSQTTPSLAWTGGAISTNKNVITPSLGSDTVANGEFTTDLTSWLSYQSTNTQVDSTVDPGTSSGGSDNGAMKVVATAGSGDGYQVQSSQVLDTWYLSSVKAYAPSANTNVNAARIAYGGLGAAAVSAENTWQTLYVTGRAGSTNNSKEIDLQPGRVTGGRIYGGTEVNDTAYFDSATSKPLTLSSLFSSVSTSDSDVIADANVTLTAGTQAGLVLNLDSTTSPANFLIVYHDGTSVKVDEAVAGVYTNKQTTTVTYSAGATLRAIREGTKLRVYHNNALVGAELTMTANTNTKHGLFSTYSGNSFDNFTLWARGTGEEYTSAPFEELTATRDTGTKYAGAASVKLVTLGTDANYLQSVNVGDTSTYTLIGYAYTTGSAVTTADLELYYNGAIVSTTFTDMTGGWYRLTGTLTGANEARDYGVKVKAGKTVYLDTLSVQAGSGATIEVTFENSSSGTSNYTFENNITGTEFIGKVDGNS